MDVIGPVVLAKIKYEYRASSLVLSNERNIEEKSYSLIKIVFYPADFPFINSNKLIEVVMEKLKTVFDIVKKYIQVHNALPHVENCRLRLWKKKIS